MKTHEELEGEEDATARALAVLLGDLAGQSESEPDGEDDEREIDLRRRGFSISSDLSNDGRQEGRTMMGTKIPVTFDARSSIGDFSP